MGADDFTIWMISNSPIMMCKYTQHVHYLPRVLARNDQLEMFDKIGAEEGHRVGLTVGNLYLKDCLTLN